MRLCLPTRDFACSWVHFDELIDVVDDLAFQAADDVTFAFTCAAGNASLRGLVVLHTDEINVR
jgi:hypothetical protein